MFCLDIPRVGSGPTTCEQNLPLWGYWQCHFHFHQNVHGTKWGSQSGERKDHSVPLALSYQWGCDFNTLKNIQSCLTSRANTNLFLWSSSLLNITDSGQDSLCLHSLEYCCMSTNGDAESPSKGLPKDSSLICTLDGPLNCRGIPGSFGPLLSCWHCNPVLRFKVACWLHCFISHTKCGIWPLKLHQSNSLSSVGV